MGAITKRIVMQLILICFILIILVGLFFLGIFIGYVFLGKGSAEDAFNPATWQHILDFVQ